MRFPIDSRLRPAAALTAGAALVLALFACQQATVPADTTTSQSGAQGLPSAHVHGLSVNSETGQVLLATHDGLFDVSKKPGRKIGATNDLMGFTATPLNTWVVSVWNSSRVKPPRAEDLVPGQPQGSGGAAREFGDVGGE